MCSILQRKEKNTYEAANRVIAGDMLETAESEEIFSRLQTLNETLQLKSKLV